MQSDLPEWVSKAPCHIRQNAIFDAHQAYSASKDCRFRSCCAPQQTIKFNDCNFSKGTWYSSLTKGLRFKASEAIPDTSSYGTQLVFSKGRWFGIFLNEDVAQSNSSQGLITLDPGVRSFLTGFDGYKFTEFGVGDMGRITRLCQHLDDLMSRISKCDNKRKRQQMRKAAGRMRTKIQDLINELHKKVACYLTQNYKIIYLPTFETSQMVAKVRRKIRAHTARAMLTWAHYRFKLFLKQTADRRGCTVIDVTEEYTSKTCTRCGHVHPKLGGSKKFKCPSCGYEIPRDFNGAFGIFLKALRDTASIVYEANSATVALSGNAQTNVA